MKQRQYITAFSLIVALTGLAPVMAADAGRTSAGERIQTDRRQIESPLGYKLSPEQMDAVHAGILPAAFIAKRIIVSAAAYAIVKGIDAATDEVPILGEITPPPPT